MVADLDITSVETNNTDIDSMSEENESNGLHSDGSENPAAEHVKFDAELLPNIHSDVERLPNIQTDSERPLGNLRRMTGARQTMGTQRLESGVVYTKWGGVAPGRVIAGRCIVKCKWDGCKYGTKLTCVYIAIASALEPLALHVETGVYTPYAGSMGSPSFNNNGGGGFNSGAGGFNNNGGSQQPGYDYNGGSSNYPGRANTDQYRGRTKRQVYQSFETLIGYYAVTLAGKLLYIHA